MRKEKGIETLDAKKLHKGLHWKGKKKKQTTRTRLAKKQVGGLWGAIMAVEMEL